MIEVETTYHGVTILATAPSNVDEFMVGLVIGTCGFSPGLKDYKLYVNDNLKDSCKAPLFPTRKALLRASFFDGCGQIHTVEVFNKGTFGNDIRIFVDGEDMSGRTIISPIFLDRLRSYLQ